MIKDVHIPVYLIYDATIHLPSLTVHFIRVFQILYAGLTTITCMHVHVCSSKYFIKYY